jgi:hypothetical protein
MISPACAVQIGSSMPSSTIDVNPTDSKNIPNDLKINNFQCKNIHNVKNSLKNSSQHKTTQKTITTKQYVENSNQNQYSDIIDNAVKILPVMQESYENSTDEIKKIEETLEELQNRKIEAINHVNQIKEELDNFEISTNNSGAYKKLQNEYKEYNNLKEDINQTSKSITDLKGVLKEKQNHTKNCVDALNQIKKSKNIPTAVETYNDNINSLGTISNSLAKQVQNNTDKIIVSSNIPNKNDTNNTNNTNNTNLNINGESTAQNLLLSGIVIGGVGFTVMSTAIVGASIGTGITVSTVIASSVMTDTCLISSMIGSYVTIGSLITGGIGIIIVLVGLACLIAYAGYKKHWWNL